MVVITFIFRINENMIRKSITFFKPDLINKIKGSKIIFYNKIYDIRSELIVPIKNVKELKIQLLLLSKISFKEIINGCILKIEYIKNNNYLFQESDIKRLPKLIYNKDEYFMDNKIRMFGKDFVKNNKDKFLILHKDKIFVEHKEFFPNKYKIKENVNTLEIYFIALDKISNVSHMFDKCSDLKEIIIQNYFEKEKNFLDDLKRNHIIKKDENKKASFY